MGGIGSFFEKLNNFSWSCINEEKKQWKKHNLLFDEKVRAKSLSILNKIEDGEEISLGCNHVRFRVNTVLWLVNTGMIADHARSMITGVPFMIMKYEHWFVKIGEYFIEFGPPFEEILPCFNNEIDNSFCNRTFSPPNQKPVDAGSYNPLLYRVNINKIWREQDPLDHIDEKASIFANIENLKTKMNPEIRARIS